MKSLKLSGFLRENVGKKDANTLRAEGKVPCVMYGGNEQVHFWAFGYDLKQVLFTPETYICEIDVVGKGLKKAVIQESQFHAVTGIIQHVDFLEFSDKKPVTVRIPVKFEGVSPGVKVGGRFAERLSKVKVKGLAKDIPDSVLINISKMEIGDVVRVKEVAIPKCTLLDAPNNPICAVTATRSSRQQASQ
jgi:large subunit ribosomal protein L25